MTLDCADLRRRAENGSVVGGRAGEVLALLDLAARLKAALEQADEEMGCNVSEEYAHDPDVMKNPCPGCAAEIAVHEALAAAREARL